MYRKLEGRNALYIITAKENRVILIEVIAHSQDGKIDGYRMNNIYKQLKEDL